MPGATFRIRSEFVNGVRIKLLKCIWIEEMEIYPPKYICTCVFNQGIVVELVKIVT